MRTIALLLIMPFATMLITGCGEEAKPPQAAGEPTAGTPEKTSPKVNKGSPGVGMDPSK